MNVDNDKDVRVIIKVKNARILRKMEERGIKSVSELSREAKISMTALHAFVNMKKPARSEFADWRKVAIQLSEFFHCLPEDLFNEAQQTTGLKRNHAAFDVSMNDVAAIVDQSTPDTPEQITFKQEGLETLTQSLLSLTPREQRVLALRYGLDGNGERSLEEIANAMNVSRERVRQIERKGLGKLRRPSHFESLKDCADSIAGFSAHKVDQWGYRKS